MNILASWIVETRTNTCLTANCPNCSHLSAVTQTHLVPRIHKKSRHNSTYSQTESKCADTLFGGTRNHRMDAVEAREDQRSRILLTCPACRLDEILERSLSFLPTASLKTAVLAKQIS